MPDWLISGLVVLNKTLFTAGLQCPLRLWKKARGHDAEREITAAERMLLAQGRRIGELARERFAGGVLIGETQIEKALRATAEALSKRPGGVFFEPAFSSDGLLARADVWDAEKGVLTEVKAITGGDKPDEAIAEKVPDVALQWHVMAQAGYEPKVAILMFVNNECRYEDLPDGLFKTADVTEQVRDHLPLLVDKVAHFKEVIGYVAAPQVEIGQRCKKPEECEFKDVCWEWLPDNHIFTVPNWHWTKYDERQELFRAGVVDASDIPPEYKLSARAKQYVRSCQTGRREVDIYALREVMESLEYPLWYFDFETMNPAVPAFPGTTAYQQWPFQFSCHVRKKRGGRLTHFEYLHVGKDDPRPGVVKAIVENFGDKGSVVAHHASFEKARLQELVVFAPEHADKLNGIIARLWDTEPVFIRHYMDHRFLGRTSIKYILPVLVPDMSYSGLAVRKGDEAQAVWLEMVSLPDGPVKRKLISGLLEYCRQDTLAMVKIVEYLFDVCDGGVSCRTQLK